jgi:DNA-binding XRE family transcriptional regulator
MKKVGGKNKPMTDSEKFEASLASMQKIVSKDYYDQFKKTDYAKVDKKVKERDALRKGNAVTVMKGNVNNKHNEPKVNIAKALDPDADIKIKEWPKEVSIQIQNLRKEANLNQDQLAKLVEVKPSFIKDAEQGVGAYDGQLFSKIKASIAKKIKQDKEKEKEKEKEEK